MSRLESRRPRVSRRRLLMGVLALAGCRAQGGSGPLVVHAAASLRGVLEQVAPEGGQVTYGYGSSALLARQLLQGAPGDLFLSADRAWVDELIAGGKARPADAREVVRNHMVLIGPKDRDFPAGLSALPLADTVALAEPQVPAGRYAEQALAGAERWPLVGPRLVRGHDVRVVLAWVAAGEADLGLVYASDAATAADRVRVLHHFSPPEGPEAVYWGVVLAQSGRPAAARAYLEVLTGPVGQAAFRGAGFDVAGSGP